MLSYGEILCNGCKDALNPPGQSSSIAMLAIAGWVFYLVTRKRWVGDGRSTRDTGTVARGRKMAAVRRIPHELHKSDAGRAAARS